MAGLGSWVLVVMLLRVACDAAVSNAHEETCLDSKANNQLVQARRSLHVHADGEEDLAATEIVRHKKCPWLLSEKGCHNDGKKPLCEDGNYSWRCSAEGHGERIQCPCHDWPRMCSHKTCRGGEYCCETTCANHGGPRPCEGDQEPEPTNEPDPEEEPELAPAPEPNNPPEPTLTSTFYDAPSGVATTSNWGSAMRELMGFCQNQGYKTGVPTGHRANVKGKEVRGIFCLKGEGVNWFDAPSSFNVEDDWGKAFRDIGSKCEGGMTPEGYGGGIPNGHEVPNLRGCYCFKRGPFFKWYDTPFSFSVNGNNDWAGALREVGGWCQKKGFDWGFPNGNEGHNVRGANCFKTG